MKKVFQVFLTIFVFTIISCSGASKKAAVEEMTLSQFKEVYSGDKTIQLVDVRTEAEFEAGHIYDAQNINFRDAEFNTQIQELNKEKPVYVYCQSGVRSTDAAMVMEESGFKKVYNLKEGYSQWE